MSEILIVGGGIIGLSLAWELAQAGRKVGIIDRCAPGKGTSWAGGGILPPPKALAMHDPVEQLRTVSHQLHPEWADRMREVTGLDSEFHRRGGVYIARQAGEAASLQLEMQQNIADGVEAKQLDSSELAECEPGLRSIADTVRLSYFCPDEILIRPPRHIKALIAACRQAGVLFHPPSEVLEILVKGGRAVGVRTKDGEHSAQHTCLCGGAWSGQLLAPLGVVLPVEPWRGQLILWKLPAPPIERVVNEGYRYLLPRVDGHLVVGATVEDVGFDDQTTTEAVDTLQEFSRGILPCLQQHTVQRVWAGLRPRTPDGRPFMGRVPGVDCMTLATGHFRSGLHLSPATAKFMAQLIQGQAVEFDLTPFRVNR